MENIGKPLIMTTYPELSRCFFLFFSFCRSFGGFASGMGSNHPFGVSICPSLFRDGEHIFHGWEKRGFPRSRYPQHPVQKSDNHQTSSNINPKKKHQTYANITTQDIPTKWRFPKIGLPQIIQVIRP